MNASTLVPSSWRIAIIGCGLMSGSVAMALRVAHRAAHITGYSPSLHSAQKALSMGVIDEVCDTPQEAMKGADVVLLGMPVGALAEVLKAIYPAISPDMLITDVGSTKANVSKMALEHLQDKASCMVPAHPIAGKEVSGVEHAQADLLRDKQVVLTPLSCNSPQSIKKAQAFWHLTGAYVTVLPPHEHDQLLAWVSHLPHLLAFVYLDTLSDQACQDQALSYAGPGFRDFSRIGASSPQVWSDIFMANQEEMLKAIGHIKTHLQQWETLLKSNDKAALEKAIAHARALRASWTLKDSSNTESI